MKEDIEEEKTSALWKSIFCTRVNEQLQQYIWKISGSPEREFAKTIASKAMQILAEELSGDAPAMNALSNEIDKLSEKLKYKITH